MLRIALVAGTVLVALVVSCLFWQVRPKSPQPRLVHGLRRLPRADRPVRGPETRAVPPRSSRIASPEASVPAATPTASLTGVVRASVTEPSPASLPLLTESGEPARDETDEPPNPEVTATEELEPSLEDPSTEPADFNRLPSPGPIDRWWGREMQQPLLSAQNPMPVRLDELVVAALNCSKQIRAARLEPFIEVENVTQQDAQFDWNTFVETLWIDTDEPTGSELDAGENQDRLLQEELTTNFGARRTNRVGGQFEVAQNTRARNSNSNFFNDTQQGISRLTLRYNQPLLRNGGRLVNEGQVLLAQLNADAVQGDTEAQVLDVVLQLAEGYWNLYRARAEYLIQRQLVQGIEELLDEIRKRKRIDAQLALVAEVESQLATQRGQLGGARIKILQAQHALVRLTGDRNLDGLELLPGDLPFLGPNTWDLQACFASALQNRPELRAALKRITTAEITVGIAKRQLLPQLAWILEANVAAINADFNIPKSLGDQFSEQGPSYTTGFTFEYPLCNRAARSRARQAELTLARDTALFEDTVDQIRQELRDAIAALDGLGNQVGARELAVSHVITEIESLTLRRQLYPEEFDQITQLYLREQLDALLRRATTEQALVGVEVDRSAAILQLRRAVGTLLCP